MCVNIVLLHIGEKVLVFHVESNVAKCDYLMVESVHNIPEVVNILYPVQKGLRDRK